MSPRREAENADLGRVDAEVLRPRAHHADRSLRVFERRGMPVGADAILEHEAGDAVLMEPSGHVVSLVADRQPAIAAARANDDRRAGGLLLCRQMAEKLRLIGRRCALGARSPLGPEQLFLLRTYEGEGREEGSAQQAGGETAR